MKRSVIVGNWKMYATSVADAHVLTTAVRNGVAGIDKIEVVLCPPALWLSELRHVVGDSSKIDLGIQDVSAYQEGAYTGEISPLMAKEMAKFAIIGHSERREYFGETNFDVNEKVLAALKVGLKPIICVGEKTRGAKLEQPVKELEEALVGVPKKDYKDIIVAYEPLWAIGTGLNAEPEYAARVISKLRESVQDSTPVLYGGSVKSDNIAGYAERPEIDGVLVGGASVRAADFVKICQIWSEKKNIK